MSVIAYFLGGPLDLSKRVIPNAQARLYGLGLGGSLAVSPLETDAVLENLDELLSTRHVYLCGPQLRIVDVKDTVRVYAYAGTEHRSQADFKWWPR